MNNSMMRTITALTLTAALCACGGGGGSSSSPLPNVVSPGNNASSPAQSVALSIRIPAATTTSSSRRPQFISSATNGAVITLTQGGAPQQTVVDLSNASPSCTVGEGGRSCTVNINMFPGSATVAITTYDTAPVGGAIPASAHILGIGSVTQVITNSPSQQILLFVGGQIAGFITSATFGSVAADGSSHSIGFAVDPVDFSDTPITAGTNDPYANPISVTLNESGGDGQSHAHLMVNGVNVGASTTLTQSSQTLALCYDGGSTPGYSATVTLSAQGAQGYSTQISPMFVAQGSTVSRHLDLQGTLSAANLTITEVNAPDGQAYTAVANESCSGIATVGSVSGSGASSSVTVTGGATPSTSGCTFVVQDGFDTQETIQVTNTPITGSVTIGGVFIEEYCVGGRPGRIAVGPDGNLWFTEPTELKSISTSGNLVTTVSLPEANLIDLTTGPDGAIWATDNNDGGVDRVTTSGLVTTYPYSMDSGGIVTSTDGTMWVTDNDGNLYNLDVGGQFSQQFGIDGTPTHIVQTADGTLWFVDSGEYIDNYNPSTQAFVRTQVDNEAQAHDLAVGPDGAIWFTADGGSPFIGRISTDGNYTETAFGLGDGGGNPQGIIGGIDDAVWYTDNSGNGSIGRVSTKTGNAMTSYGLVQITGSSGRPSSITLGPDGSLWYTDPSTHSIGHVEP